MTDTPPAQDRYAGLGASYYWFFILFMVALSMFGSFVNDMYIPALPEMTRYFHTDASTCQLGLSFGMIGLAIGQIVFGPVSDKYGRKGILNAGMLIFIAGGTASVFATGIHFFICCRLVQGIGASTGYFLARTMPADITYGRTLAKTMALIGAINGIAPASAPVLGGLLTHWLGWRSIFVCLTLMAALMLLINTKLKETLPSERRYRQSLWKAFEGYRSLIVKSRFMVHVLLKGAALGLLFAYIASAPFIMQTHFGYSELPDAVLPGPYLHNEQYPGHERGQGGCRTRFRYPGSHGLCLRSRRHSPHRLGRHTALHSFGVRRRNRFRNRLLTALPTHTARTEGLTYDLLTRGHPVHTG